jgi:hypothetical protein
MKHLVNSVRAIPIKHHNKNKTLCYIQLAKAIYLAGKTYGQAQ